MDKKADKDWGPYYLVLGEFVVDFENIVFAIREDCSYLLRAKGLTDSVIGDIIFGQKYLTAEPLVSCYVTMVNHIIKHADNKEAICKRLDKFRNKLSSLIEARNDIVHSTHFFVESINIVGPPKFETEFKAYKPSPKKTGYHLKKTPRTQIIEYTGQLKELKKEFKILVEDLHKFLKENKLIAGSR
jgi:hypothetical protein